MNYVILGIKNYDNFKGRASLSEYWMFILIAITSPFIILLLSYSVSYILYITCKILLSKQLSFAHLVHKWLILIGLLIMFISVISISFRRMHDMGKSGWFIFLPFYNLILLCSPGDEGDNKYGPPSQN